MHTHKIVYIKSFKIAPTCFDHAIIIRELRCSLLKLRLKKHSLIDFPIIIWCCGSMSYCVGRASLRVRRTMCVVCYAARDWLWVTCNPQYGRYLPYDTHESVSTQQRERMIVDPVNQYQKL